MLSINLTEPTLQANEIIAPSSRLTCVNGCMVALLSTDMYWISDTNGSLPSTDLIVSCNSQLSIEEVDDNALPPPPPPATAVRGRRSHWSHAAHKARYTTGAARRSAVVKYAFRLDMANPSASRTVSFTTISMSISKSCTIRRIMTHWAASFCPKYALVGWTIWNSLVTIVATPRKWPGRARPSAVSSNPCKRLHCIVLNCVLFCVVVYILHLRNCENHSIKKWVQWWKTKSEMDVPPGQHRWHDLDRTCYQLLVQINGPDDPESAVKRNIWLMSDNIYMHDQANTYLIHLSEPTTPNSFNNSESRSNCLGYLSKSSVGPNCVGLTKMDATTTVFLARASRSKDKWPAWCVRVKYKTVRECCAVSIYPSIYVSFPPTVTKARHYGMSLYIPMACRYTYLYEGLPWWVRIQSIRMDPRLAAWHE